MRNEKDNQQEKGVGERKESATLKLKNNHIIYFWLFLEFEWKKS